MKTAGFAKMNCSLAQTLSAVGGHWTLLILRDVFFGLSRFDEFQQSLGIARNILSQRLKSLVAEGILERTRVAGDGRGFAYHLTDRGRDLQPVLLAMTQWGDRWKGSPEGTRIEFIDRLGRQPIRTMRPISQDGRTLQPEEIRARPGPGFGENGRIGRLRGKPQDGKNA